MIVPPPKYLYIVLTTRCNLHCQQCYIWTLDESQENVSVDDLCSVIQEFYELNHTGRVIITGGEPLTDPDSFFKLTSLCRELGLFCAINTNGTYINPSIASRVFTEGPNHFVISLDSQFQEVHDCVRGTLGTYAKVLEGIKLLVDLKKKAYTTTDVQIYTHTILFDENIKLWADYIEFARNLGVDGVMFSVLEKSYLVRKRRDLFFEKHNLSDMGNANQYIEEIIDLYGNDPFVINSVTGLEMMKCYIDNEKYSEKQICDSCNKNIMIDVNGFVQLCFSMRDLLDGQTLGNIKEQQLREMWYSSYATEARKIMVNCRKKCGINDCHRKNGKPF